MVLIAVVSVLVIAVPFVLLLMSVVIDDLDYDNRIKINIYVCINDKQFPPYSSSCNIDNNDNNNTNIFTPITS